jgi:transposase InsO family protein
MTYSLNALYTIVGITKQAVDAHSKRQASFWIQMECLLLEVDRLREIHGGCGLEKMYRTLRPDFVGRDRFIAILQQLGYGLKRKRSGIRTTFSSIYRYKNLIEGLLVYNINQVWQSDITYIFANGSYYYATFIVDVYSKRILGYQVSDHMYTTANIAALKQAFKVRGEDSLQGLIHHSDRGSQYGANDYVSMLLEAGAAISMGKKAQENAYAERVNGIIKNEYLAFKTLSTFQDVKREVRKAVLHYNNHRIHNHLPNDMTPNQFEEQLKIDFNVLRPFIIIHSMDRPDYHEAKSRKKPTLINMEKNTTFGQCPLVNNHYFFNQNGQH